MWEGGEVVKEVREGIQKLHTRMGHDPNFTVIHFFFLSVHIVQHFELQGRCLIIFLIIINYHYYWKKKVSQGILY